jgi:hypothetical protein
LRENAADALQMKEIAQVGGGNDNLVATERSEDGYFDFLALPAGTSQRYGLNDTILAV